MVAVVGTPVILNTHTIKYYFARPDPIGSPTATKSKGDYGLGEVTSAQAERIGQAWVGEGAKVASDGKTMVSADGLRQYRPATPKDSPYATTGVQANLQSRNVASGGWQSNGHINILGK